MKLLFDQNLSFRLCRQLADLFPASRSVRELGLERAGDGEIWDFAKSNDFILVSQDADFAEISALRGPPPKVIWLRCGNQPTPIVLSIMRYHAEAIAAFEADGDAAFLEIY
jgi:predicted nuclease of predicted toxin-antitoxin system